MDGIDSQALIPLSIVRFFDVFDLFPFVSSSLWNKSINLTKSCVGESTSSMDSEDGMFLFSEISRVGGSSFLPSFSAKESCKGDHHTPRKG